MLVAVAPAEGDAGSRRLKPAAQIVARLMKHGTTVAPASLPVMFRWAAIGRKTAQRQAISGGDIVKHSRVTAGSFAAVLSPLAGIAASLAGALPARGVDVPFTEHVISTAPTAPFPFLRRT